MTNDYKEKLLKYFTNNLDITSGTNIPEFLPMESNTSTAYDEMVSEIGTAIYQNGQISLKDINGVENGFVATYGAYKDTNDVYWGYIALFNESLDLMDVIIEYKSGTKLSPIITLSVDNEGKLFGIDVHENKFRFIMLNNITIKTDLQPNYIAVLRQSYFIPYGETASYKETFIGVIDKSPIDSRYFMVIYDKGLSIQTNSYYAILLRINVGQANEWEQFTIGIENNKIYALRKLYVYYKDDGIDVDMFLHNQNNGQTESYLEEYTNDLNPTALENIFEINIVGALFDDIKGYQNFFVGFQSPTIVSKSYNRIDYIMGTASYEDNGTYKLITRIADEMGNMFYEDEEISTSTRPGAVNDLHKQDNVIMATQSFDISATLERYNAYIITEDKNVVKQPITNAIASSTANLDVFITVITFNLVSFYKLSNDLEEGWITKIAKTVYNPYNYNGLPYEEARCLLPQQTFVYSGGKLVFARNIYNKTLNQNITTVVGEIPNTMLNDITLDKQDLIGYTNYTLVENQETIEKNIYENLYINFFNTLMIQNRNNPNNVINNLNGAIRLNNSVSNLCDYENATITKYKINYNDGSNEVKNIRRCTITNNIATFEIAVMVSKLIDTIDLISEDETTTYQTIDCSNMEVSKMYSIKQDCYVE